ncbi:MAG: ATP-dependent Clp protease proteolytic subunit [Candidatus Gracilibacteria bacterium]|nr:ATP-dependent Clp protease proteolytic subunit [Candidatus Gracilibacteria bacterium]
MPSKKKKSTLYTFDTQEILQSHRQLFLYGVIDNKSANFIKQNLIAFDIVNKKQPISLWISSPGGKVDAGFSIIEVMKNISAPVITIISGEACSMAALISVCGNLRYAFKDTSFWMAHPMVSGIDDYIEIIKDRTAYLENLNNILLKIIKDNTKLPDSKMQKLKTGEVWLRDKDLLTYGIVDKLL